MTVKQTKKRAAAVLRDNRIKCMIGALIPVFVVLVGVQEFFLIASLVPFPLVWALLIAAYTVFLAVPVSLGTLRWFYRLRLGMAEDPAACFYYFSDRKCYMRAVEFAGLRLFKFVKYLALALIPALFVGILSSESLYAALGISVPDLVFSLPTVARVLSVLALVAAALAMLKYYPAPFILVADAEISPENALKRSAVISSATGMEFVALGFGLLHWIVLSLFTVPLPFTLPYLLTCYIEHTDVAVGRYNRSVSENAAAPRVFDLLRKDALS